MTGKGALPPFAARPLLPRCFRRQRTSARPCFSCLFAGLDSFVTLRNTIHAALHSFSRPFFALCTVIFGNQFHYYRAIIPQQHFFLMPLDAVDAHAEALSDLRVGQAFPEQQENFLAARRKMQRVCGVFRGISQGMQHFTSCTRSGSFAERIQGFFHCPFADEQLCRNRFSYSDPASTTQ